MGIVAAIYGLICYAVFFVTFLYSIAFVENVYLPKTIDSGVSGSTGAALLADAVLLGIFAVQHSGMARPGFKKVWARLVPPSIERSTYVLITSLLLALIYWKWQPIPAIVWDVAGSARRMALIAVSVVGWLIVLTSTFMINHFDLFGLRQVYLRMQNRPYTHLQFTQAALYRFVRHPIMLGFIIAFWATPTMSVGHLLFAIATTGYILIGVTLEERDLVTYHGDAYRAYQKRVPMLLPIGGGKGNAGDS
jgi:methanethiol S-methyltransferase